MTWQRPTLITVFILSVIPLYGAPAVALGTLLLAAVCGLWIWMES